MKYMKLLAMMAICAGMASCSSNDEDTTTPQPTAKKVQMTFTGTVDNGNIQRTVIGEDGLSVNFVKGDKISVFDGTSNNEFSTENSGATAKFTGTAAEVGNYAILYPYQAGASYNGAAITATIPAEQTATNYKVDEKDCPTFDPAANVSVAMATADVPFQLKNVCSLIRFNTTENCESVTLSDGKGGYVAGQVSIAFDANGYPVTTVVEGSKTVTLKNVEANKVYYIAVLPGTIDLNLSFMNKSGYGCTKTKANVALERNKVLNIGKIVYKPEWVDLGLPSGIKWATCNLGADSPEKKGDYYRWSELEPSTGGWKTFPYGSVFNYKTMYPLPLDYDAAYQTRGRNWRMPTIVEMQELDRTCPQYFTNNYKETGMTGIILYKPKGDDVNKNFEYTSFRNADNTYSPNDDAHIFLPITGQYKSETLFDNTNNVCLWSSTLSNCYNNDAISISASTNNVSASGNFNTLDGNTGNWYVAKPIRPVYVGN